MYKKYQCDNISMYFSSQDGRPISYAIGEYDNFVNTLMVKQACVCNQGKGVLQLEIWVRGWCWEAGEGSRRQQWRVSGPLPETGGVGRDKAGASWGK